MFATSNVERLNASNAAMHAVAAHGYTGPERRTTPRRDWLAAVLDELDYGLLLVTEAGHVTQANHVAQGDLDSEHPLQLLGRELRARHAHDVLPLHTALQNAAHRGLRKLLTLGDNTQRVSVSIVPLGIDHSRSEASTLLILGKRQMCESLSVQGYARSHSLTPAEVAAQLGVGIATVRSQIGSIRQKTGADSIRSLVRQVAVLPPLMGVLRHAMAA